jgi:hypothetical protein
MSYHCSHHYFFVATGKSQSSRFSESIFLHGFFLLPQDESKLSPKSEAVGVLRMMNVMGTQRLFWSLCARLAISISTPCALPHL